MINMFIHNFKYAFKTLFRNKGLIFWTFAFPIMLATFFNMAFSNIENSEKLDIINIAIVNDDQFENNEIFKNTFEKLSDEKNEDRLFNTKYVTEDEAKELLSNDKITGYLKIENDEPKITVMTSGINETVFRQVTEEIVQTKEIVKNLSEEQIKTQMMSGNTNINYEKLYNDIIEMANNQKANIKDASPNKLSYAMIEFYTLIAMACLYGGTLGMASINQNLANMGSKGKRVSISPISKVKIILSSVLASYITGLIGITVLFVYTIFGLKVDYGSNLPLIIALAMAGSLAGLTIGVAVGTVLKTNENAKVGIIISITMAGCFLSGMMGVTMKYIVDTHVPILNKINPASMITDGFYSLYYYDTLDRYWFNIASLLIFSAVMIILSFSSLRRQKYDSI